MVFAVCLFRFGAMRRTSNGNNYSKQNLFTVNIRLKPHPVSRCSYELQHYNLTLVAPSHKIERWKCIRKLKVIQTIYSFIFSRHFVLIRVVFKPEAILGRLDIGLYRVKMWKWHTVASHLKQINKDLGLCLRKTFWKSLPLLVTYVSLVTYVQK